MSSPAVPGQTNFVPRLLQHHGETGLEVQRIASISVNYGVSGFWIVSLGNLEVCVGKRISWRSSFSDIDCVFWLTFGNKVSRHQSLFFFGVSEIWLWRSHQPFSQSPNGKLSPKPLTVLPALAVSRWVRVWTLESECLSSHSSCRISDKSLNFFVPKFYHLKNWHINSS